MRGNTTTLTKDVVAILALAVAESCPTIGTPCENIVVLPGLKILTTFIIERQILCSSDHHQPSTASNSSIFCRCIHRAHWNWMSSQQLCWPKKAKRKTKFKRTVIASQHSKTWNIHWDDIFECSNHKPTNMKWKLCTHKGHEWIEKAVKGELTKIFSKIQQWCWINPQILICTHGFHVINATSSLNHFASLILIML